AATIAAMVEAVRNSASVPVPAAEGSRRKSMLGKLFAGKALAAAATVVLTAGAAAAAAGTLPTPVQGVVADAVSHIGIDLPDNHGHDAADEGDDNGADDDTTSTTGGTENHGDDQGTGAGDGAGKGQIISGITHDPALDGQPKGPTVCTEASDGQCKAGDDHGGNGGQGSDNSGPGSNSGNGNTTPGTPRGGIDDPAGHDAGDDHGGTTSTTVTTVTTASPSTTATTADDGTGASGNSSNNSGKGKGKGRSGTDD